MLSGHGIAVGDSLEAAVMLVDYGKRAVLDELAGVLGIDLAGYLAEEKPYLTSQQVKSLLDDSFDIGAHSLDHPRYATIPFDDQVRQTLSSVRQLRSEFGLSGAYFAFPFNDEGVSRRLFERIADDIDLCFATEGPAVDEFSWNIQRFPMDSEQTAGALLWRPALLRRYSALRRAVRSGRRPVWTNRRVHPVDAQASSPVVQQ